MLSVLNKLYKAKKVGLKRRFFLINVFDNLPQYSLAVLDLVITSSVKFVLV